MNFKIPASLKENSPPSPNTEIGMDFNITEKLFILTIFTAGPQQQRNTHPIVE
jgi:hypothetical protein